MWDTVEKILVGVLVVLILFWFRPGIKNALENSRKATSEDWKSLAVPLIIVVLFVVFLISLA